MGGEHLDYFLYPTQNAGAPHGLRPKYLLWHNCAHQVHWESLLRVPVPAETRLARAKEKDISVVFGITPTERLPGSALAFS